MTVSSIQYAFVSGEISPTLFGRTDLEKYDLGLSLAKNWIVDYRGGLTTRPGTIFAELVQHDDKATKLARFRYAPDVANTYCLLFGDEYLRFLQDGAYVLEAEKAVTNISTANPPVATSAAHGYSEGDWVKIDGRTFEVGTTTTDTFELLNPSGSNIDGDAGGAISVSAVARVYTLATPYAAEDLAHLRIKQHLNEVWLTHPDFAPRKLERIDSTNWTISTIAINNSVAPPTGVTIASNGAGSHTAVFAVTAVDADGNESLPTYAVGEGLVDFSAASETITTSWTASADAVSYNIYRSLLIDETTFSSGQQLGYLGTARGLSFVDNNILPDFTTTPPNGFSPFEGGAIDSITMTNVGSGYDYDTTVGASGGTGFNGFPLVNADGEIEGVLIIWGGKGYTTPTISFTGAGSGAAATATVTPATGNFPRLFTVFQQRGLFAATENKPITLWGSKPGAFEDFSFSDIVVEDDSYEFTLDAEEIAPIRHLIPSRGGLLIMTQSGIWLLTGGNETAVSAINALADPQSFNGVSEVEPLQIGPDILYIEGKGASVKLLSYNDFSKVYGGVSMSILANHLFSADKQITAWTYAESPMNLVYGVRSDGALLAFTYVKEQNVYAWTQNWTRGQFLDVLAVQSGVEDLVYTMTRRKVNGRWTKMIEVMASREIATVEDAWCVDCGLATTNTYPDAELSFSAKEGTAVVITASAAVFGSGDVGKVLRAGGGKATVTECTDTTHVVVSFVQPITVTLPEDDTIPLEVASGDWTLDTPVSSVSGLWHLEGETVAILADGNVMPNRVVVDGAVTLDYPATKVVVGLPYTCIARNLPITSQQGVVEDKRKRLTGIAARIHDTRGLKVGRTLNQLRPMKERTNEALGEPTRLIRDMKYVAIESAFDKNGQSYFVQEFPLPATLLAYVQNLEIGDDDDDR